MFRWKRERKRESFCLVFGLLAASYFYKVL